MVHYVENAGEGIFDQVSNLSCTNCGEYSCAGMKRSVRVRLDSVRRACAPWIAVREVLLKANVAESACAVNLLLDMCSLFSSIDVQRNAYRRSTLQLINP